MRGLLRKVISRRLRALFVKELQQLRRNRRLVEMLIIPPTVNLILFGLALNPAVKNLRLGVVDDSRSAESRELVSAFVESGPFHVGGYYTSADDMGRALAAGKLDTGLVVPPDFARKRQRRETAEVQFLVDAVNANNATIAEGYASLVVASINQRLARAQTPQTEAGKAQTPPLLLSRAVVRPRVALLYNPGLENSWFIVTGLIGTLLLLQGLLVSAATLVREKETGTVEQLLMTPAEAYEIIAAKIAPLFIVLTGGMGLSLTVARLVFGVPMRGSLALMFVAGMLCVLTGIGIGTLIATFTHTQQQAQLMGFFTNPPLAMLSGAMTPIEAMPDWLQPLTYLNPVRHFGVISRGVLLKGAGLSVLYPNFLALLGFAVVLVAVSTWQFRKRLG